jgi:hypothetical protein
MKMRQLTLHALAEGMITMEKAEQICPGCTESASHRTGATTRQMLLQMPYHNRALVLAGMAAEAAEHYGDEGAEIESLDFVDHYDVTD